VVDQHLSAFTHSHLQFRSANVAPAATDLFYVSENSPFSCQHHSRDLFYGIEDAPNGERYDLIYLIVTVLLLDTTTKIQLYFVIGSHISKFNEDDYRLPNQEDLSGYNHDANDISTEWNDSIALVVAPASASQAQPTMEEIFLLCNDDIWNIVLDFVIQFPPIGTNIMTMGNGKMTTIIHHAMISQSKGSEAVREQVITTILEQTPKAAELKNDYGNTPLHTIFQRNNIMDETTNSRLINEILDVCPKAMMQTNVSDDRTPLHMIFTGNGIAHVHFSLTQNLTLFLNG
jgi:hypothetical protein